VQVVALALEEAVRLDRCYQIEVAAGASGVPRLSLSGDAHPGTVPDSGRNPDLEPLDTGSTPRTLTGCADGVLDAAGTLAAGAGLFGFKTEPTTGSVKGFFQCHLNWVFEVTATSGPSPAAGGAETLEKVTEEAVQVSLLKAEALSTP